MANAQTGLTGAGLKTPRAAAIAGIVFSVLLLTIIVLLRISVPLDPLASEAWLWANAGKLTVALNLIPFSGVAFLWFMGVLRDRLGPLEDRFFATVFFGSGLLFLAMLFVAGSVASALLLSYRNEGDTVIPSVTFTMARSLSYSIMNVYAVKVAGVFMITTSTITIFTGIAARWIAFLGYVLAGFLLLSFGFAGWVLLVFPLWILLLSTYVLVDNLQRPGTADEANLPR